MSACFCNETSELFDLTKRVGQEVMGNSIYNGEADPSSPEAQGAVMWLSDLVEKLSHLGHVMHSPRSGHDKLVSEGKYLMNILSKSEVESDSFQYPPHLVFKNTKNFSISEVKELVQLIVRKAQENYASAS